LLQGEWPPRCLETGHLRDAPSQGRPEVRVATESAHSTFPEQSSGSVVLQGEWRHVCALHLPKALLEVGVATGPDGPKPLLGGEGSQERVDMTCCGRFGKPVLPRVPHPHPQKSKGVA